MLKSFKYFFLLIGVLLFFTTCKKYPENNLWFKNPKGVIRAVWFLEKYTVNGIDSTYYDDIALYKGKGLDFTLHGDNNKDQSIRTYEQFHGSWEMAKNKKYIKISFFREPVYFGGSQYIRQKNIFIIEKGLDWRIDKLCKDQFWISLTYNNIKYEIRFKS